MIDPVERTLVDAANNWRRVLANAESQAAKLRRELTVQDDLITEAQIAVSDHESLLAMVQDYGESR